MSALDRILDGAPLRPAVAEVAESTAAAAGRGPLPAAPLVPAADDIERDPPRLAMPPPLGKLIERQSRLYAHQPMRLPDWPPPRIAAAEDNRAAFDGPQRIERASREADQPGPPARSDRTSAVRHDGGLAFIPRATTTGATIDGSKDAADEPVLPVHLVRPVSTPPTRPAIGPAAPETRIDASPPLTPSPRLPAIGVPAFAEATPQQAADVAADTPALATRREPPNLSPLDPAVWTPPDLTPAASSPRRSEVPPAAAATLPAPLVRPALPPEIVSSQQPQQPPPPVTASVQNTPETTASLRMTPSRAAVESTGPARLLAPVASAAAAPTAREPLTPRQNLTWPEPQRAVDTTEPRGPTVEIGRVEIRVQAPKPAPLVSRVAARPHGIEHGLSFGAGRRW
jgi:hypothetical protein